MDKKLAPETVKILKPYLEKIRKKFKPEKIILFGSRARKDNLKSSDFDLIIVSERFSSLPWRKRIIDVAMLWDEKFILDSLCYTPEEFEKKKNQICIVKKAVEEGITV